MFISFFAKFTEFSSKQLVQRGPARTNSYCHLRVEGSNLTKFQDKATESYVIVFCTDLYETIEKNAISKL